MAITAHQVLLQAVVEKEAAHVASKATSLVATIKDALEHALEQSNHFTTKFTTNMGADNYLQLLGQLVAAHPMNARESVRAGVLPLAARALRSDPNRFYMEVRRAAEYVQYVLQASAGRHVNDVREVAGMKEGVLPACIAFFFLHIAAPSHSHSHSHIAYLNATRLSATRFPKHSFFLDILLSYPSS